MNAYVPPSLSEWPLKCRCETIARFWGLHWSAIQLTVLRDKGEHHLATLKYSILRRHQRSHFLPGVDKLGDALQWFLAHRSDVFASDRVWAISGESIFFDARENTVDPHFI